MKKIVPILFIILVMAGCADPAKLDFVGVDQVITRSISATGIDLEVIGVIGNEGRKDVIIREFEADFFSRNTKVCNVVLSNPLRIPGSSEGEVSADFRLRIARINLMALLDIMNDRTSVVVKGWVRVNGTGLDRKIRFERRIDSPEFLDLITSQLDI